MGSPSPLLANVRELRFRVQLPHSTLPMLKVRRMAHSSAQVHSQCPLPALQQHPAQQRCGHDQHLLPALQQHLAHMFQERHVLTRCLAASCHHSNLVPLTPLHPCTFTPLPRPPLAPYPCLSLAIGSPLPPLQELQQKLEDTINVCLPSKNVRHSDLLMEVVKFTESGAEMMVKVRLGARQAGGCGWCGQVWGRLKLLLQRTCNLYHTVGACAAELCIM